MSSLLYNGTTRFVLGALLEELYHEATAVERRDRQQVHDTERHRDHGHELYTGEAGAFSTCATACVLRERSPTMRNSTHCVENRDVVPAL